MKAINDIIKRESHRAPDTSASRGNKKIIRGLYYTSKFIRDLQNCRELRDFFKKICGEELVPHPSYSNSPQVKFGIYDLVAICVNKLFYKQLILAEPRNLSTVSASLN